MKIMVEEQIDLFVGGRRHVEIGVGGGFLLTTGFDDELKDGSEDLLNHAAYRGRRHTRSVNMALSRTNLQAMPARTATNRPSPHRAPEGRWRYEW
ncbi:hypothetical protein [Paenibacillus sp. SI8]|uniref:hypothetical protein n=1 Tax=unclassified Paenibacillus TaxID=185978 RepID=UPI003467BEED